MAYWTFQSNVADVLSLGPRTAGRLGQFGVRTVTQLIAADPQALAERLRDERFTAEVVADWQREAKLLIDAPELAGEAARVLAAAGFNSAQRVARATPTELLAAVEQLAQDESRASWFAQLPKASVQKVNAWIQCAQQSLAARAA
jgi:Domain of unknown function (DUF4332)